MDFRKCFLWNKCYLNKVEVKIFKSYILHLRMSQRFKENTGKQSEHHIGNYENKNDFKRQ